ncbi:TRAP transporter small permease [Roseibium aestuarii]|uniref:TRAP transporter small permease protein n=1 Tax=Roseibium aestuarii TaxID=2600299 RepID=A0ABW4JZQ2_9HYPH|nr:TRAP transporter small permease subunit [Roseibium aestuarii]
MNMVGLLARRIFGLGAGLSMALVFAIIFINSLRRYTVGSSVAWGEELPIYLTIYGVMFGCALAYLQDRHIRFTILTDLLRPGIRDRLFAGVDLLTIAAGIGLMLSGHDFASRRGHIAASGLRSLGQSLAETTGIEALEGLARIGTWQFAMTLGGAMLALAALIRFSERLTGDKTVA